MRNITENIVDKIKTHVSYSEKYFFVVVNHALHEII
jgi:hypothetical protein